MNASSFWDFAWSPELPAFHFFLWGYLKSKAFVIKPHTFAELKELHFELVCCNIGVYDP